jgi:uncharacterized protein YmfQ (DUF2313 family)
VSNIFTAPDKNTTAQQFATSLPDGRAWANKNISGSNVRKLINSVSVPFNLFEQLVQTMDEQFRIHQTYDLINEWEKSVGIPDSCLWESDTLDKRREMVITRLRKKPLVTLGDIQQFVNNLFPTVTIEIFPGLDYYTFEYGFEVPFLGAVNERFILVVNIYSGGETFEYDLELPFVGGPDTDKFRCVLEKIVPSEVYIIINLKDLTE